MDVGGAGRLLRRLLVRGRGAAGLRRGGHRHDDRDGAGVDAGNRAGRGCRFQRALCFQLDQRHERWRRIRGMATGRGRHRRAFHLDFDRQCGRQRRHRYRRAVVGAVGLQRHDRGGAAAGRRRPGDRPNPAGFVRQRPGGQRPVGRNRIAQRRRFQPVGILLLRRRGRRNDHESFRELCGVHGGQRQHGSRRRPGHLSANRGLDRFEGLRECRHRQARHRIGLGISHHADGEPLRQRRPSHAGVRSFEIRLRHRADAGAACRRRFDLRPSRRQPDAAGKPGHANRPDHQRHRRIQDPARGRECRQQPVLSRQRQADPERGRGRTYQLRRERRARPDRNVHSVHEQRASDRLPAHGRDELSRRGDLGRQHHATCGRDDGPGRLRAGAGALLELGSGQRQQLRCVREQPAGVHRRVGVRRHESRHRLFPQGIHGGCHAHRGNRAGAPRGRGSAVPQRPAD